VDGSSRIPTGIDRYKPGGYSGISGLVTAQKFLHPRIEGTIPNIRINTEGIAVPNVYYGAGQRRAVVAPDFMDAKRELEWKTFLTEPSEGSDRMSERLSRSSTK
jgi:hypothetical protein